MIALIVRSVSAWGPQAARRMRRGLLGAVWLTCLGALPVCVASTPNAPPPPPTRPVILVLGDSLSAEYGLARGRGWVQLMATRITQHGWPHQVVNASISGETTAGGHTRLPALLAQHRPSVVILELGGNDALRGLDLRATEAELRAMIKLIQRAKARTILLGMRVPPNYGKTYSAAFESIYQTLATTEKLPWVPFFLAGFAERPDYFQADQIHPSERAQPLMLDAVWPTLVPLLQALASKAAQRG